MQRSYQTGWGLSKSLLCDLRELMFKALQVTPTLAYVKVDSDIFTHYLNIIDFPFNSFELVIRYCSVVAQIKLVILVIHEDIANLSNKTQNLLWLRLRGRARLRQQGQVPDRELADWAVHEAGHKHSLLTMQIKRYTDDGQFAR